jgi:hypothetical protein
VRVVLRTDVSLGFLALASIGIFIVCAVISILQRSCGGLVLWNGNLSSFKDGLEVLLVLLNDLLNRASQATLPFGHCDIVNADIAQDLEVISAHADEDLIGTVSHVLFDVLGQVHDHIANHLGGSLEHVVLLSSDVVCHVNLHSVELTRTRLIDADVINDEHGVADIGSEFAVDIALTLVDQVDHLATKVGKYSLIVGKLLCEQTKARIAPVRERVDFDGFVESAQIVGETFGTRLQDMWETTLEGLLPAVCKVLVDWLSAVFSVSKYESATEIV